MYHKALCVLGILLVLFMVPVAHAGVLGQIELKDGSRLLGEIIEMTEGKLKIKAAFTVGDPIVINWSDVVGLMSEESLILVLNNGITLNGKPRMDESGTLQIQTTLLKRSLPVNVDSVIAINPPPKKAVVYTGNINFGGSINSGNTKLKNASFLGELIARSDRLRLTILGRWIYGEEGSGLIARNTYGTIKLDFFITERFYAYTSAIFEQDTFQDLQLRTSINAGPGYQIIDKGDFVSPYFREMLLSGEIGLGFFNEDFKIAPDQSYVTARWSIDLLWPVLPTVTLFHQHQGYPSLETHKRFLCHESAGYSIEYMEKLHIQSSS